jgi:hypothetical protein
MHSKLDYDDIIQNLESFKKLPMEIKMADLLHSLKFLSVSAG